jgi:hypothetical protein
VAEDGGIHVIRSHEKAVEKVTVEEIPVSTD